MGCLNDRAYNIMRAEVNKCAEAEGLAGPVQKQIIMRRLDKMRSQKTDNFAQEEDLRQTVKDIFPEFSEKVIKDAAKVNHPPNLLEQSWGCFTLISGLTLGGLGFMWFVNLPYPMIRGPVSKTAPLLLFPSYLSMDYNYRQAIVMSEQADQLINKATAEADFDLGAEKAQKAQKHLDELPVWFLGYYPQIYCSLFRCTWRFTLDEFKSVREKIGRMDAQIFQQKNAFRQLNQAETSLNTSKQQYQQAKNALERQQATSDWQGAIDSLSQIPEETLAGKLSRKKVDIARRDFQQVGGIATGNQLTDNLIEAAKEFAMQASVMSQNPPHPVEKWEEIMNLWQEAINRLQDVKLGSPGYLESQTKLAQYKTNLATVKVRLKAEKESVEAFKRAKTSLTYLQRYVKESQGNSGDYLSKLQEIINELEQVKQGTTVYPEAQKWLASARQKLQ
jgi:hypothetical protein